MRQWHCEGLLGTSELFLNQPEWNFKTAARKYCTDAKRMLGMGVIETWVFSLRQFHGSDVASYVTRWGFSNVLNYDRYQCWLSLFDLKWNQIWRYESSSVISHFFELASQNEPLQYRDYGNYESGTRDDPIGQSALIYKGLPHLPPS